MPKAPIIIEFLGSPGVGKTTLAHMLYKKYSKSVNVKLIKTSKNRFKRFFIKSFLFGSYFVIHPIQAFNIMKVIKSTSQSSTKDLMKMIFNHIYLMGLYNTFQNKVIIDQGLAQSIWSIQLTAQNRLTNLEILLPKHNGNIVYIYIDAPYEEIRKRLDSRNEVNSRVEKNSLLLNSDLKNNFTDIVDFIKSKSMLVQVNNCGQPELSVKNIEKKLMKYL